MINKDSRSTRQQLEDIDTVTTDRKELQNLTRLHIFGIARSMRQGSYNILVLKMVLDESKHFPPIFCIALIIAGGPRYRIESPLDHYQITDYGSEYIVHPSPISTCYNQTKYRSQKTNSNVLSYSFQ